MQTTSATVTLVSLLVTIVLPFAASVAAILFKQIESRLPAARRDQVSALQYDLSQLARTIVAGVEQRNATAKLDNAGKKSLALDTITALLAQHHIVVPSGMLDLLIESAVAELPKLLPPAPALSAI